MSFSKINFIAILVYLIPLAILTGSFLPDLMVSLVSLLFLIFFLKKNFLYNNKNYLILFGVFYFYLVFTSFISEYRVFSLESSIPYLRFIIFALAVSFLIENKNNFLKDFFYIFLLTFIVAILSGYLQYFFGFSLIGIVPTDPNRLTLPFNDKMYLGGYIARLLPLLLGLMIYLYGTNKKNYLLLSIISFLSIILIFLSGERTAFALITLFFFYFFLFSSKVRYLKLLGIIIILFSVVIIFIISSFDLEIKKRQFNHTISQITLINESTNLKFFSTTHDQYFQKSIKIFKSNYFFGIGPNGFREECKKYPIEHDIACSTHPHNNYIQIAAETGIFGLTFLLFLLLYLASKFIHHLISLIRNKEPLLSNYQICLYGCFLLSLWPIIPTQNFFNGWINIIYFLPVGFYLNSIKKVQ